MIHEIVGPRRGSAVFAALITASLSLLLVATASGTSVRSAAALLIIVTFAALARLMYVAWPQAIAALILVILFIPIRRYALPGSLPFELEPYRVVVGLLVVVWAAALLADPRIRLRTTGFEAPLAVIVGSAFASLALNHERVAQVAPYVNKKMTFFLSFVLVLYLIASVTRRLRDVDYLVKALVAGGAVVALSAIVESRTSFNMFNHIERVVPMLRTIDPTGGEAFLRFGSARLRVFGSAQHPIAMGAAFVVLAPLAVYLAHRYSQRRWIFCGVLLVAGCAATVSRTAIVMLGVAGLVFLWLRPRETLKAWPVMLVALIVIKVAMPGTLGTIKQSFLPPGGLVSEQYGAAGTSGSGRLADVAPALDEWARQPVLGQGFGTRIIDVAPVNPLVPTADILDNQWLASLLETGAVGAAAWLWLFVRAVRRFGAEARRDDSARGWLLASLAAGVAAFAVGMFTYDAFSFIQVTFLLFIYLALGSALVAERPMPLAARIGRRAS